MDLDRLATRLAADQGGVLRREQALELGLTRGSIAYRVKVGRWDPVARSVYRVLSMRSLEDRLRSAVAALPGAVVSHESAAELHAIPSVTRGRAVVTVHTRTTHDFADVQVHRSHDLSASHMTRIKGLPVTNPARTIVDLASVLGRRHVASVVDDLVTAKQLSLDDLRATADQVLRRGKPGSAALRKLLEERGDGPEANASRLERAGYRLLSETGLPQPRLEFPIPWDPQRRFDLAFPEARLAIEWDSRRWHTQVDAFDRDRERDRQAVRNGWRLLRYTWQDLTTRPGDIVDTVRSLLDL
jgi:hypothetical protein